MQGREFLRESLLQDEGCCDAACVAVHANSLSRSSIRISGAVEFLSNRVGELMGEKFEVRCF